ncbi:MAG: hypothetical protein GTN62_00175 [Gemmatimonadales bacterium]|nr:hypothetical protein [Gemmatimonadales bacterium]NIN09821.1 hypothetical protein [Gemmatimonadales bacterium]NIN48524.1 hypothetical protein [Gemmatimonadales bacterium]NIP05988.1 hypothetical protein [Gemmatimonadales bacterium]NIR01138.1 hypothetical protein [Gemmatimonadales bacterium]
MKKLAKLLVLVLVVLAAVPVAQYRTVKPCSMLKKELVKQAREEIEKASSQAREAVGQFGEEAERVAGEVGAVVEDVTAGVAAGVAEARVERMSVGECVQELWREKFGGES